VYAVRKDTVLSEIGFPSHAAATKFAPHGRQGLFGPLVEFRIAFYRKPWLTSGLPFLSNSEYSRVIVITIVITIVRVITIT
jgi:hypothetical protein